MEMAELLERGGSLSTGDRSTSSTLPLSTSSKGGDGSPLCRGVDLLERGGSESHGKELLERDGSESPLKWLKCSYQCVECWEGVK